MYRVVQGGVTPSDSMSMYSFFLPTASSYTIPLPLYCIALILCGYAAVGCRLCGWHDSASALQSAHVHPIPLNGSAPSGTARCQELHEALVVSTVIRGGQQTIAAQSVLHGKESAFSRLTLGIGASRFNGIFNVVSD